MLSLDEHHVNKVSMLSQTTNGRSILILHTTIIILIKATLYLNCLEEALLLLYIIFAAGTTVCMNNIGASKKGNDVGAINLLFLDTQYLYKCNNILDDAFV